MWWRWATVVGLTLTPALIAGQSAGIAAGIAHGFDPVHIIAVVSLTSFLGGLFLIKLAELSRRIAWLRRILERFHTPRAVAWCQKWGPWGGLTLGTAVIGPEPILIALKWMMVDTRKIVLPLALSSVLFTVIYYYIVSTGFDQGPKLWDELAMIWRLW